MRRRAAALGLEDRVRLLPGCGQRALATRYRAADAVLFPSSWPEPWGLVPLEAMACGVPVVASGTGGSADYLRPGENALVTGPDDPGATAAAVRRLAASPALRRRLTEGGRATAAAHPPERAHAAVRRALEAAVRDARDTPATGRARAGALPGPGAGSAPRGARSAGW